MSSSSRQPRKWTTAEDQKLREEVNAQIYASGEIKDWCRIANQLPGRTNKDCRKRWHNSVAGGLKKGQWSKSEDMLLAQGVEQYGPRWTLVANCVESRSADQCAKRWQQSLDPELDRSEWQEEEDRILIEATQELGRHWKDIQKQHFPGRSKNCIKNRYTVLIRRYQNQAITLHSRDNSPSEANTPGATSPYSQDDEEYPPYTTDCYGHLMPPQASGTSAGSHCSWPSFDSDGAPWSAAQGYSLSVPATTSELTHSTGSMYEDPMAQPQTFGSPMSAAPASNWDWTTIDMHQTTMRSPVPYFDAPHHPPPYDDDYSVSRPTMSPSRSYSSSTPRATYPPMVNPTTTNVPRASSWPEQLHYHSLSFASYDARLQHNPSCQY